MCSVVGLNYTIGWVGVNETFNQAGLIIVQLLGLKTVEQAKELF